MAESAALLSKNLAAVQRPYVPARELQFANATLFMLASLFLMIELVMFNQKWTYPGISGCLPPYNYTSCIIIHAGYPPTATPDNVAVPFALANLIGFLSSLMFTQAFLMLIYFLHMVLEAGAVSIGIAILNLVASLMCIWQPISSLTVCPYLIFVYGMWARSAEFANY
jgi:hypothetical protein